MSGLWRNDPATKGGKYLVTRRDGTHPRWLYIVLGSPDEAAPAGLRAYADKAADLGFDPDYVRDVRRLADEFEDEFAQNDSGDPDAPRHRQDDPETVARMKEGKGA